MAAYLDTLPRASFNGVEFAWDDLSIRSSLRHHVHEYRHTGGGALEKQGRSLYRIRFAGWFDEQLASLKKPFKGNYPEGLYAIRTMFENEETHDLVVPTLGTIKACLVEFEQRSTPEKNRSGERAELAFIEDQSSKFLVESLFIDLTSSGLPSAMTGILDTATSLKVPTNIFDDITDAVNGVLAIRDTADMYSQLAAAKVLGLANLLGEADRTLDALQDPTNHALLEAVKVLWAQTNELAKNVTGNQAAIHTKTTPRRMTIQEVSVWIFGRSDRSFDILQLNEFDDALAIPGGTSVRYFEAA